MTKTQKVFLAMPTHDGRINSGSAQSLYANNSQVHDVYIKVGTISLLNYNMNKLWADALNMHEEHPDMKWFAMLHSDVYSEPYWIDKLIEIAEKYQIDMLSAAVAIKDDSGDTSTGISNPQNDHWNLKRISIDQIQLFERDMKVPLSAMAFDYNQILLANTGCMICRIDKPWSSEVLFKTEERLHRNGLGHWEAFCDSEDWNFSRQVHDRGGIVAVTSAVKTWHVGRKVFANFKD